MARLTVPQILDIPEKLVPIITEINKYRYFLIEGGRGGGKSQSVGRLFLYLAEQKNLRMVCGRETQNSINESVYSLLADLIRSYSLCFEVGASKITHKETETSINFRGFREQGSFNIQGMEGIDVLWIDEAQAITKQTLDVLIPTVRKENAKIFFTMNRHVHNDPVYSKFIGRDDCLHLKINYDDNKYCTQALKKEADECRKKSEDDYQHIWLGEPLAKSEDCVFGIDELMSCKNNKYPLRQGYGMRLAGFDIARYGDDKCSCVVIQQMGALHWEVVFVDEWNHKDLNYTTGRILATATEQQINKSVIDEDGIGAGPLDNLNKGRGLENFLGFRNSIFNFNDNKFFANRRTQQVYKLKDLMLKGHIHIEDEALLRELEEGFRYTFDHNQRKILISKEIMKVKHKVKSPNRADGLIMAVSLIEDIKAKQDVQYYRPVQSSREENLFGIAGVR